MIGVYPIGISMTITLSLWYQRTYSLLSKIYSVNNLRCAYCTTYYTVIAKAETFTEDLR